MNAQPAEDTLARMFRSRVERSGGHPAQMVKRGSRWETLDWSQVGTQVRELALDPFISQALVYGDGRPYPVALVTVDPDAAAKLARSAGIVWTDPAHLAEQPEVLSRVERIVAEKNAQLQSYARIKRFAVLPTELSEEAGEVTATQKLKRKKVAEKYADVLESLYESKGTGERG